MATLPPPAEHIRHFTLDREVVFLNHGSFGACPRPVLAEQDRLRARMEAEPVRFFVDELEGLLDAARADLAAFVGADPQDLVFVPNATAGVNAVLRSLRLQPGDELLLTDQGYNACNNALRYVAERQGALVRTIALPFPLTGADATPEGLVGRVLAEVTPRTRLALLDHITSPTALVLPIAALVAALHARGVDTLVDGAHAPGMVPLDVTAIGAAYYTGNCHKWLCAPKGAGFLHVRRDRQEDLVPTIVSHGYNATRGDRPRLHLLFDWTGTSDPTAMLCVPAALRFLGGLLPGGLPALQAHNRSLALAARAHLCAALAAPPPCPDEMVGFMAAVPLRDGSGEAPRTPLYADPLQLELLARHAIQVPVVPWPAPPRRLVRISAQVYNSMAQYEHLAMALRQLL
jgi:isopenicillin-N epimerase